MRRRYRWFRGIGCSPLDAMASAAPQWVQTLVILVIAALAGTGIARVLADWEPWR